MSEEVDGDVRVKRTWGEWGQVSTNSQQRF